MADLDGKALREEVGAVLMLHREGRRDEAIARAMDLAIKHRKSALALNLSGDLNLKAYFRNRERNAELAEKQIKFAVASYKLAVDAAPSCIETITAHGEAISALKRHKRAEEEFARAMAVARPADPAMQHAAYGLDCSEHSTKKERIRMAKEKLRRAIDGNCNAICEDDIVQVLGVVKSSGAASAVDSATDVAKRFPLSARAQCLPAHVGLELARSLRPGMNKKETLRCALDITGDAARTFHRSLVIALFRGKLLAVLHEYDAAKSECYRALRIEMPDDPKAHDIPLGSIDGEDYDDRVSSVKEQIHGLLKKLVPLAVHHWSFMPSESQNRILSVRVDTLHEHYSKIDQRAAKTISDALRFFRSNNSWSFWICPHPNCDGKTDMFLRNDLLVKHMRTKHLMGLWEKLQSVLDLKLCENTSKGYCSSDVIALCQDSGQHDVFRFIRMQDIFESLVLRPTNGTESQPFVEVRTKKCREGTGILSGITEKLRTLPSDMLSNEFAHARSGIQDLWLKFLNISVFDYCEVISPLARSFQWRELKKWMAQEASIAGRSIDSADIDAIFVDVRGAPDMEKHSIPSQVHKIEVRVEDSNSGAMVNQKSSDPPNDIGDNGMKLAAKLANVELETKETSDQSAEEIASMSSYQRSVDVLNKCNADEDLFILHVMIQSLWNLRHFRDIFLRGPPIWILPNHDKACIAEVFYEIFCSLEKNVHNRMADLLTSVKATLCEIANDSNKFQKLQVGKNCASEIVAIILKGLHLSENSEIERQVVNPISCGDCICRTHNLFGIKFYVQMSCRCGKKFDEKEHTTIIHKLDAGSPQTTKIKSFAELPVLLDEQLFCKGTCEHCGSPKNIDLFLSNTPHLFTIVLNWLGGNKSQAALIELLSGITSTLDINFFCKNVYFAKKYTLGSMICLVDGNYISCAREKGKWLVYSSKSVEVLDSWDHLLNIYNDCRLQPEVLFFEGEAPSESQSSFLVNPSLFKRPPDVARNSQATRYGHAALHRRAVGPVATASTCRLYEIVDEMDNFDPYAIKLSHEEYGRAIKRIPLECEFCAICFFERCSTPNIRKGQLMHHCQSVHNSVGIKCHLCTARFLKESDIRHHVKYYHG